MKYREYDVVFHKERKEWEACKNGKEICENADLDKVTEYIDKLEKGDFKRISAYYNGGYSRREYAVVTVTSIDDDKEHGWIKDADGNREKVRRKELIEITPTNTAKIKRIGEIGEEVKKLESEERKMTESMTWIK